MGKPNPYVDNARPSHGHTHATIGGRSVRVLVAAGSNPAMRTKHGPLIMYYAHTEDRDGPIAYGKGPSEAVANLDKMLSVYSF